MKSVTYEQVLNAAAEKAGRTRDKIPVSEAVILREGIAEGLYEIWNCEAWPELTLMPEQFTPDADRNVSKREDNDQDLQELGEVLGCYTPGNPRATTRTRAVGFDEGDGAIRLQESVGSVWVEYMRPCPDVEELSDEALAAVEIPSRFKKFLVLYGAAQLLRADGNDNGANGLLQLAEGNLARQLMRLPPPPWYRSGVRLRDEGRAGGVGAATSGTTSSGGSSGSSTATQEPQVYSFAGDPNGNVTATAVPALCYDTVNKMTWWKLTGAGDNTGWE